MAIKIYGYNKCSTCQKALKFLDSRRLKYENLPIVETPPTVQELKKMLKELQSRGGSFKNLFNTSGLQYRELGISDQLKNGMTEEQALKLLSENGKLIKRPFIFTEKGGTVGFQEDLWKKLV